MLRALSIAMLFLMSAPLYANTTEASQDSSEVKETTPSGSSKTTKKTKKRSKKTSSTSTATEDQKLQTQDPVPPDGQAAPNEPAGK